MKALAKPAAKLLARYPAPVQELAAHARDYVLRVLTGAEERVDEPARLLAYGLGPGYKGLVCTLILSKSGVKLGLNRGSELADPEGLLEGSGKVHRYVQLDSSADLERRGVARLLEAADEARRGRQAAPAKGRR